MSTDKRDAPVPGRSGESGESEPFIARWSRLKRGEAQAPRVAPAAPEAPARPGEKPAAGEAGATPATAVPEPVPAPLPRIEDLTPASDLTAFMQKGVPEALRRHALRRMWTLDPAIRDFVEVAENQYDWNVPGGAPGYGDLDPGTDMKVLLDQALGRTEAPIQAEAEAVPARPATADERTGSAAAAPEIAHSRPGKGAGAHAGDTGTAESSAARSDIAPDGRHDGESDRPETRADAAGAPPSPPGVDAAGAGSVRRRHGGALPRDPI